MDQTGSYGRRRQGSADWLLPVVTWILKIAVILLVLWVLWQVFTMVRVLMQSIASGLKGLLGLFGFDQSSAQDKQRQTTIEQNASQPGGSVWSPSSQLVSQWQSQLSAPGGVDDSEYASALQAWRDQVLSWPYGFNTTAMQNWLQNSVGNQGALLNFEAWYQAKYGISFFSFWENGNVLLFQGWPNAAHVVQIDQTAENLPVGDSSFGGHIQDPSVPTN